MFVRGRTGLPILAVVRESTAIRDLHAAVDKMSSPAKSKLDSPIKDNAPSTPFSANLTVLASESPTFAYIEYFLRLSLCASTARIERAWEVSNPQLTLQFDKRSRSVLTVDAWVEISSGAECGSRQSEEDIIKRGFVTDGNDGVRFRVGKLRMATKAGEKVSRRFLLCKVAIGRAYNATEDYARINRVPDGYDSFVIDDAGSSAAVSVDPSEPVPDSMEYIVKDTSQILPTYVAVIDFDDEAEGKSRQRVLCENCEQHPAVVFCKADAASLCRACDEQVHQAKLSHKHHRVPLESGPQTFASCRQHPERLVEYYCPTCSRPVCVNCKMIGHHSTGEAAKHRLVTVQEAFRTVSEAASAHDPILAQRRTAISQRLSLVSERAKAVQDNADAIQRLLADLYARAEADVRAIARRKLNVLRGDCRELARELAEISQLELFVRYQRDGSDATQFILDWAHHQRLRNELHAFPFAREGIDVEADIRLNGALQVHAATLGSGGDIPVQPVMASGADDSKASGLFERPKKSNRPSPSIFDLAAMAAASKSRKPTEFE